MPRMLIENFGPIHRADLALGDLTVFVGPQATGKSIALQTLRLLVDAPYVVQELQRHGLDWSNGPRPEFLEVYFGEGMKESWSEGLARLEWDGAGRDLGPLAKRPRRRVVRKARLFYVPAQRVLALRNGWPRPFTDFSPGDPFAIREFSERLRLLLELEFSKDQERLFPGTQRLNATLKKVVQSAFFPGFELLVDHYRSQKRLVLRRQKSEQQLPFMVWSTGQREFIPLLLGLYWLMPAGSTSRRDEIEWVVIEEPEMGLHPKAISALLMLLMELLRRGYRVCLSTHSPAVLDLVWALGLLKEHGAPADKVLDLFGAPHSKPLRDAARAVLEKELRVHYFDPNGDAHDISRLDPGSRLPEEASWGGLGEFGARTADVVAGVVSASERRPRP